MKKIFFLIILIIPFQTLADDIRNFQIEGMSIGDGALNYFDERQLEDGEQGWHNYSYSEYSTSLVSGKGIYDWFLVSYRNDDDNFKIEALVGGLEIINYSNKECNNRLDSVALSISESFKNTREDKKKYKLTADSSRIYPFTGKSTVTSLSFNFTNEGEIILSCYNMDKKANKNSNFIMSTLNQKDSFRINVRSHAFINYLKKEE
ncbi:hypothetical protein OAJ64_00015 [Pelagibacteraceae bacterium]|nr:hypothetical protein [Pelagibacteraceae bacterium]